MTPRLRILPRAELDAQQIFDWLQEHSPQGALTWWRAFTHAVSQLPREHTRFAVAPEDDITSYKLQQAFFKTPHGRTYRLVFTIVEDELRILRVRGPGQPPLAPDELTNG